MLKGLIFAADGSAMSPTHTRKGGRLYRYYVSQSVMKQGVRGNTVARLPAAEVEAAVIAQLRRLLGAPEIIAATWRAAAQQDEQIAEAEVRDALTSFHPLWNELFPAEQARIVQLMIERVDVTDAGLSITLRTEGLAGLVDELRGSAPFLEQAA